MKARVLRAALLILGSVGAGYWLILISSPWWSRVLLPRTLQNVSDVKRAVALAPWVTGIPHFVAAGVAGLSLGYVTARTRMLAWSAGLVATITVWFYGLQLWSGSAVAGGIVTSIAQALVASLVAVVCLALGRRLQGHEPVA